MGNITQNKSFDELNELEKLFWKPSYPTMLNMIAALKEPDDKEYMKDLVYKENPVLRLIPKNPKK